ncbi:MAG: TRAP transporter small permease [Spirochaetales bacterium]|jgi:TRAP-type C4-dicarboxylate transport system permease small subunit|nr:TRAP transporter small permease [Spirochaetales bacterium]
MEKKKRFSIEGYLAACLLFSLTILLAVQIFMRFVLGTGLSWSEELSRYMFVWSIYFGCILAAKEDKHIRVTAQLMFLSERTKAWFVSISDIIWVAFNALVAYFGFTYILSMFEYPFYSQTMGFNLAWIYAVVPISYAMMCIHVVVLIYKRVKNLLTHKKVDIVDSRLNM